jgi:hypothetical protein
VKPLGGGLRVGAGVVVKRNNEAVPLAPGKVPHKTAGQSQQSQQSQHGKQQVAAAGGAGKPKLSRKQQQKLDRDLRFVM